MDITTLKTFLAAADAGSFIGAAQRVNISPSSVTERIKQLEHRLGVRLFDRNRRGCVLTPAGKKLIQPASQAVRALDTARHEVSLPVRYTRSISFAAQFTLWNEPLMQWLALFRDEQADLAMRVSSGASVRLSRDLAEGFLDIALLYDPIFRRDVRSEPLFDDRLVLVAGGCDVNWRSRYVRIEWGRGLGSEIASRSDLIPEAGLVLDLGGRSAEWLVAHKMAGYMPRRSVATMLKSGALHLIEEAPQFDFPAYVCWRRDLDCQLADEIVSGLKMLFSKLG